MVSPLIALMIDQVRSLRERSVEAVVISSGSRETSAVDKEFLATEENMKSAIIIFSSPEALAYQVETSSGTPLCVQQSMCHCN